MGDFLKKLLLGITRTPRQLLEEARIQQVRNKEFGTFGDPSFVDPRKTSVDYKPMFTSNEETGQIIKDPHGTKARQLLDILSYAVPVGGGIKGLATSGAIAGGLQGASQTRNFKDFGQVGADVLGGAAIGGLTGAAIGGLGKLGEAATKRLEPGYIPRSEFTPRELKTAGMTTGKTSQAVTKGYPKSIKGFGIDDLIDEIEVIGNRPFSMEGAKRLRDIERVLGTSGDGSMASQVKPALDMYLKGTGVEREFLDQATQSGAKSGTNVLREFGLDTKLSPKDTSSLMRDAGVRDTIGQYSGSFRDKLGAVQKDIYNTTKGLGEMQSVATKQGIMIDTGSIADDVATQLGNTSAARSTATNDFIARLAKKNQLTPTELGMMSAKLKSEVADIRSAIALGNSSPKITSKAESLLAQQSAVDKALKGALEPLAPNYPSELLRLGALKEANTALNKTVQNGTKIGIPNTPLEMNVQNQLSSLTDTLGSRFPASMQGLQQRGAGLVAGLNPQTNRIMGALSKSSIPGALGASGILSALSGGMQEPANLESIAPVLPTDSNEADPAEQRQYERAQAIDTLRSQGMKLTEAISYVNAVLPEIKPTNERLTEKQRGYRDAANSAEKALSLLSSGKASTGKVSALTNDVAEFFGTLGQDEIEYRSYIALARTALRNAMLGANMSPKELESLSNAIPEFSDEPAIAQQKLKIFAQQMKLYAK